ncbi:hypothetical protein G9A89_017630 [Geosiphon pyriformis]|nr:hypothetical protein G9A89_017630 [Geosiphon pyriformis]
MVRKTKSSEKWEQLLVSAIVTPNLFVVSNKILDKISDKISIVSFSTSSKMGQDQLLAVLPNVVSSGRSLPVLETKQSLPVESPVLENWADQMETESSPFLKTIISCQRFAGWVASTLVLDAIFKIKLAHVKTVFQSVHGFLGAKLVLKDNVKLFCVEFASQVSLEAVFLVELTSSIHLATLKIAKSLVVSKSGFSSAAVVLHNVPLGVSIADIKTVLSVFGSVTHIVLKPVGIWQYMVVYFEKLDSAMSALNHWSVLVSKNNIKILPLVNQNETILSHDKFKAKLVNLLSGCTAFEISDMISQVGGQTCFIPHFPESGRYSWFALITFGFQANLNSAIVKTDTLRKYCICHLTADCKISLPPSPKFLKVFTSCFVGSKSYAKASASLGSSEFLSLLSLVFSPVVVGDFLVLFCLSSLKFDLTKLSVLVESIDKLIGSLVTTFKQFINSDLITSSALGLRINEVLVHMSFFSRTVGKLGREVVSLKKKCCIENIDMSGNSELLPVVDDEMFSNLMSL